MVAPNKIMKLPIFVFCIFEKFNLVSKFEIDLSQFWILNFYLFAGQEFAFDKYL